MNKKGQSLVEFALLFPVAIFVFAVLYYLILFVRTEIQLRESAYHIAYRVALGQSPTTAFLLETAPLERLNFRWGIVDPARSSVQTLAIPEWQSYTGIGTLDGPGIMIQAEVVYDLFPHQYGDGWIPWMTLHARCELPQVPLIPGVNI